MVLLSTTYFGPVQWYQKLYRYNSVLIEQHETFQKQTYRNRCLIATTQGVQVLTVPIDHSPLTIDHSPLTIDHSPLTIDHFPGSAANGQCSMVNGQSIRVSDHGNWRHQHWQAITSAYGESPFFEFYEDDVKPFFTERNWELLIDYNEAICLKMCELLDIHPNISRTTEYVTSHPSPLTPHSSPLKDFRDVINPKHPKPDPEFVPREYYQVFREKHGFLPNLSILDLLFNMGPESIFYL